MTHVACGNPPAHIIRKTFFLSFAVCLCFAVISVFGFNLSDSFASGKVSSIKNSKSSSSQSYRARINAVDVVAGGKVLTGSGIVIGIYDSGINLDNPVFEKNGASRIVSQACVGKSSEVNPCESNPQRAVQNSCSTQDVGCFHGMSVAGFAAGNESKVNLNGSSVDVGGIAPDANISYVRDAMDKAGTIKYDDFVTALNKYVKDVQDGSPSAPDVLNLSLSFPRDSYLDCEEENEAKHAIDFLVNSGVVVVSSSGNNSNKNAISYPACMKNVIAVGSSGQNISSDGSVSEHVSKFSNMSSDIDLVAPGENQWGIMPEQSRFAIVNGTSFAAPIVSGVVALIKQVNPNLTPSQIKELLVNSGDDITDPATGQTYKKVNAAKAVAQLSGSNQLVSNSGKNEQAQEISSQSDVSAKTPEGTKEVVSSDSSKSSSNPIFQVQSQPVKPRSTSFYLPMIIAVILSLIISSVFLVRLVRRRTQETKIREIGFSSFGASGFSESDEIEIDLIRLESLENQNNLVRD